MRINLALILSIIVAVGIVALVFTAFQISSEKQKLNNELQAKTVRLAEDFYKSYFRHLEDRDSIPLKGITDSVINQYSFIGLAIYYNRDSITPLNNATEILLQHSSDYITRAVSADTSMLKEMEKNFLRSQKDRALKVSSPKTEIAVMNLTHEAGTG